MKHLAVLPSLALVQSSGPNALLVSFAIFIKVPERLPAFDANKFKLLILLQQEFYNGRVTEMLFKLVFN